MSRRLSPARCRSARLRVVCSTRELAVYRERTLSLLRRYSRLAIEIGRLPSLLGREFFPANVSTLQVPTFEETVIFVHDVERCLARLQTFEQKLVATMVLQDYTGDEAAVLLGCDRRTITRLYPMALNRLTRMFLDGGLLQPLERHVLDPETGAPR